MKKLSKKNDELYDQHYYQIQGYGFGATDRQDHKRIIELLRKYKTNRVLEIGVGLGILLQRIKAKKKVGTETNEYAIKACKKLGISVIKNDAEKGLPFKDSSFDAIIMNEVIEHFKKPKPVVLDCYRILAPYGKIVISTPAKSFFAHDLTESHFSEMTQEVNGITFLYPIIENFLYKPFRLLRYFFVKNKIKKTTPISMIDSVHGLADKTILKPLNRYRNFLLSIGQQQLILAEKQ